MEKIQWKAMVRSVFLLLVKPTAWISGIALIVSFVAKHFNPTDADLLAVFGLFFPLILFTVFISMLILAFLRSRLAYLQLFLLILALPTAYRFIAFPGENKSFSYSAISYNLHGFKGFRNSDNAQFVPIAITDFLEEVQADVVCLQEFRSWTGNIQKDIRTIADSSGYRYHHFAGYWKRGGLQSDGFLILSRHPIVNQGLVPSATRRNIGIYADIQLDSIHLVRFVNVHLISFSLQQSEIEMFGKAAELEMDKLRRHGFSLLNKLLTSFRIRSVELADLKKFLDRNTLPVIVAGDFNDTPSSYTYHRMLNQGLYDAHSRAGKWVGATYAGKLPGLRIDYFFVSKTVIPSRTNIYYLPWSDHYPLKLGFDMQHVPKVKI